MRTKKETADQEKDNQKSGWWAWVSIVEKFSGKDMF